MASRELAGEDRITDARLIGTAQRHARVRGGPSGDLELSEAELAEAIAELREIATERAQKPTRQRPSRPRRFRSDLLEHAAGVLLGGWQHDPLSHWDGRAAALLLVHAGADPETVKTYAAEVRQRLDRDAAAGPGIGNPQPRAR